MPGCPAEAGCPPAHIGLAKVKKATTDFGAISVRHHLAGIAVASVLGFIPWNRPLLPF
jgi:hypothetical protein